MQASPKDVFDVLDDSTNHRALTCRPIQLVDVSRDGDGRILGVIDVRAPLGIHRRIATREIGRHVSSTIWGLAASSSGSVAQVRWDLEEVTRGQTRVSLSILPVRLVRRDQALLVLGGRRVLARILRDTIGRLETLLPEGEPDKTWSLDEAKSA